MSEEEANDQGFTVKDRRRFDAEGQTRESDREADRSSEEREETSDRTAAPAPEEGESAAATDDEPASAGEPMGELTFSGFVIGLAQQAFMFLGVIPDPQSSVVHKDLLQARAMIDIIEMLRDKTRGNLEEVEERLIEEMLEELHMQYVREVRASMEPKGGNQ